MVLTKKSPIKRIFSLLLISAGLLLFTFTGTAAASTSVECNKPGIEIVPTWYKYVDQKAVDGQCELQFNFPSDISLVLLAVIEILLRVAALAAVAFIIYAGFMYMTSQGEPDRAKNAQQSLLNAVIGLVIALLSTGLVAFIGGQLAK